MSDTQEAPVCVMPTTKDLIKQALIRLWPVDFTLTVEEK
jgi:hypothetical protein